MGKFWEHEPRDAEGQWTRLAGLMHSAGGFTSLNGEPVTTGFAVAVPSKSGKDWETLPHGSTSAADIEKFARKYAKELAKPGRAIGGWSNSDPEMGEVRDALDIVHVYDNDVDAAHAAYPEQDAFYDLGAGREVTAKEVFDRLRTEQAKDPAAQKRKAEYDKRMAALAEKHNKAYTDTIYKHPTRAGLFGVGYDSRAVRKAMRDMSVQTPVYAGEYDLTLEGGKVAFWKQILPKRLIHYTAKDGSRQTLNFDEKYLTDLATNKAVDKVGFLLADIDNRHTMDPERWRGEVAEFQVRDDGLYGKIVFPNKEAAQAVLANPDLGVSARIREGISKDDGSTVARGIVHVLGTLDPQVSGMAGWTPTDLSTEQETLLDLTAETYEDGTMADKTRSVTDYTEEDLVNMTDEEFEAFLVQANEEFEGILDEVEGDLDENEDPEPERTPEVMASLSTEAQAEIDLANTRASRALAELAQARWERTREQYLNAGVPAASVDLCEPVFNRPNEFIVDLSTEGTPGEIHVGEIVSKLLDALKGTIDLSAEQGHSGVFKSGDGEDPDKQILDLWEASQG